MRKIKDWRELEPEFNEGILLGNGASAAVHPGFRYVSLYEAASDRGHLTDEVAKVFRAFEVDDFELVLRRLWHASLVNRALSIPANKVEVAYEQVRQALIATVRDVHLPFNEALPHLGNIYRFLSRFKTVLSLNYDLIVYWAAMHSRRELGNWFKDCFITDKFREEWWSLREPKDADGATLFFYPHGNLALIRNIAEEERKVIAGGRDLLGEILSHWQTGNAAPLFVCEGTSRHKRNAIGTSAYLQQVYADVIPFVGTSLVIYGWSMGEQDKHILDQLKDARCRRVAVSVWQNDMEYVEYAEAKLRDVGAEEVVFFRSTSPGCWNNPN
jgi:hypothetical protein